MRPDDFVFYPGLAIPIYRDSYSLKKKEPTMQTSLYHVIDGNTHYILGSYTTEQEAIASAEKNATIRPGTDFVVMKAISKSSTPKVLTTRF